MPKHVWKCDYCSQTKKTFDDANAHEKGCSQNPTNRHCYTCKNYEGDGFYIYGETYTCKVGQVNIDDYEYDGNCPLWEKY